MYDKSIRRSAVTVAVALGLAGAFFAGAALASDPLLDQANDSIIKAIAQLQAAQNANGPAKDPFGGHREKAIQELKDAQAQIVKAKEFANAPPKPPHTPKPKG
jgi:hypothetical protein